MTAIEKPADASGVALTAGLGCILYYEVTGTRGAHGQTVGADGAGEFAEVFLGDPFAAGEAAALRIREMESNGVRFGHVGIVQHGDCFGYHGSPVRVTHLPPNDQAHRGGAA